MKAICEGRSTRNDVVQQNLEQYRAVFQRTTQQINVLKAVSLCCQFFVRMTRLIWVLLQAVRKYVVRPAGGA